MLFGHPYDTPGTDPDIYGVTGIFAESDFTITAAKGYEDTDENYDASRSAFLLINNIAATPAKDIRVVSGATIKVDVPFYYSTETGAFLKSTTNFSDAWRDIVKTDKGTLEFTKGYYNRDPIPVPGSVTVFTPAIYKPRPLDIVIEDGVVSIPSDVVDSNRHGTILGNVVFDYVTAHTTNRTPTLKVTGTSELFWPVSFTNDALQNVIFRNYVSADKTAAKTTPNATYDIDKGATLALGYDLDANDIFYGNNVQLTGKDKATNEETTQEVVKTGLGTLDFNYGAVGSVAFSDTIPAGAPHDYRFIEKFTVEAGSIEAPYGTPFIYGDLHTRAEVYKDATFVTGGGEHRTWDPKDAVTKVRSFWGKLGSTLDVKSGLFAIYDNRNADGTLHSVISGDVIGKGGLEAHDDGLNLNKIKTIVEIHGNKNTYAGGTYIYPDAVVSFYRQNGLGTGPIVGEGGEIEVASAGSNWIDLPNKIELEEKTDGLTFSVPTNKVVKQTLGVGYTTALLSKAGEGELILAGEGEAAYRGDVNWISTKGFSLAALEGTVVLDHSKAAGHAGVGVSDGAVVRAFNGFSGDNTFFLYDGNATPTLDSAIGAVISATKPALVTSESFNAEGDFSFQIYPRERINKGDKVAVLKADEFDIDLSKFDATVTDVAGKKFTTLAIAEAEGNTLELTAAKNIDVPTITTSSSLNVDVKKDIEIVVNVASTTPISKEVKVISDIPSMRVSEVDVPGRTFTIKGVAPEEAAVFPVRVYVTTTGDWVTDTVDTDGITVYEDFVLTVGGDAPNPPAPVEGPKLTLSGYAINDTLTSLSGTVGYTDKGQPSTEAVPVEVAVYEGDTLVKSVDVTIPANTATTTFAIDATYKYDTDYKLTAKAATTEAEPVTTTYTKAKSPITGDGGSSGCDAGFGAFALLAAAGAVTLLRKKG
jgi:Synergist-CTERM protein sorting domain-containing protein